MSTKDVSSKERIKKENSVAEVKSKTLGNKTATLHLGRTVTNLLKKDKTDELPKQKSQPSAHHEPTQGRREITLLSEKTRDSVFTESGNDGM